MKHTLTTIMHEAFLDACAKMNRGRAFTPIFRPLFPAQNFCAYFFVDSEVGHGQGGVTKPEEGKAFTYAFWRILHLLISIFRRARKREKLCQERA